MYAFVEQFMTAENSWQFEFPHAEGDDAEVIVGDPDWKMSVIVDERDQEKKYFKISSFLDILN